jgi:AcrR family transcriptional regulator
MERTVRETILDSAFEVLAETGPAKMRIQEVARRAEVSPTLLYYYFDGKHALIAAAYARDYAKILLEDRAALDEAFSTAGSLQEFTAAVATRLNDEGAAERCSRRLAVLSNAQHDSVIADEIREPLKAAFSHLESVFAGCKERGWLHADDDISARALLWLTMPLGTVFSFLAPTLELDPSTWLGSRGAVARS